MMRGGACSGLFVFEMAEGLFGHVTADGAGQRQEVAFKGGDGSAG